jgi:hypothetical protein
VEDPESAARASLFRSMTIYVALLLPTLAVLVWIATSNPTGFAYFSMSVAGVVALLLGYQAFAHYRDMRSALAESEGIVQRIWSRADLIIAWHSYYVAVDVGAERKLFRLQPEDYVLIEDRFRTLARVDPPLEMYVKVVHFPTTLNVVSVHEIVRPQPDPATPA